MKVPPPQQLINILNSAMKKEAERRGRSDKVVRREYFLKQFLCSINSDSTSDKWVVKGGVGLLLRIPNARYTSDLDLVASSEMDLLADAQLLKAVAESCVGIFDFEVAVKERQRSGISLHGTVKIGRKTVQEFTIDLASRASENFEYISLDNDVRNEYLNSNGLIPLIGLDRQVADKICAMYSLYGTQPSSRYHDLVDLLLIQRHLSFDLKLTANAVLQEVSRRESCTLPTSLQAPSAQWASQWSSNVGATDLPDAFRNFEFALVEARKCYDPILSYSGGSGLWSPEVQNWI